MDCISDPKRCGEGVIMTLKRMLLQRGILLCFRVLSVLSDTISCIM